MSNKKKKLNALLVALYFLKLAKQKKEPITNKKLQKLVYYAQAWSLVLNNEKLFSDPIEAWVHGPAIRSLYDRYKKFGFNPIKEDSEVNETDIPKDVKKVLDSVWGVYGKMDADYLELLTHSEDPWQEARKGLQFDESSGNEISLEVMKNYYSRKLAEVSKK
jgi:uncharacterized phage-associated protein